MPNDHAYIPAYTRLLGAVYVLFSLLPCISSSPAHTAASTTAPHLRPLPSGTRLFSTPVSSHTYPPHSTAVSTTIHHIDDSSSAASSLFVDIIQCMKGMLTGCPFK